MKTPRVLLQMCALCTYRAISNELLGLGRDTVTGLSGLPKEHMT